MALFILQLATVFGLYVHFPYCRAKCPYCDFAVAVRRRLPHREYADAVLAELGARASLYSIEAQRALVSVYFGGGTPGLWEPVEIARVIDGARAMFAAGGRPLEITVEANPDDLPAERLAALRAAGVNRLSIGAQTFHPHHLAALGRLHGPDETRRAVRSARAAGFDNLSLDLMFALPGQTMAELAADLAALVELDPDHLSVYSLTVEDRTPFGAFARRGRLVVPPSEAQAEMYERVEEALRGAGYVHYEVSSYARPGRESVHNNLYWIGGQWLGLGCSAHSFRRLAAGGGERFWSVRSVDRYLAGAHALRPGVLDDDDPILAGREALDAQALAREAMWLGLRRLADGIDRRAFAALHGVDPTVRFAVEIADLVRLGLVEVAPDRLRLSARGALFADEVGARFV